MHIKLRFCHKNSSVILFCGIIDDAGFFKQKSFPGRTRILAVLSLLWFFQSGVTQQLFFKSNWFLCEQYNSRDSKVFFRVIGVFFFESRKIKAKILSIGMSSQPYIISLGLTKSLNSTCSFPNIFGSFQYFEIGRNYSDKVSQFYCTS